MSIYSLILSVGMDQFLFPTSALSTIIVLYVGPDQLLPVVSALGAAVGILLIGWHYMVALGRRVWQSVTKRSTAAGSEVAAPKTIARTDSAIGKRKEDPAG